MSATMQKTTNRPTETGWATLAVLVLALLAAGATEYWQYIRDWSPLEHYYAKTYVQTWVRGHFLPDSEDKYVLLFASNRRHQDVLPNRDEVDYAVDPQRELPYVLSQQARQKGLSNLRTVLDTASNAKLHDALTRDVFYDQKLYAMRAVYIGLVVLLLGLCWSVPTDRRRKRTLKYGRQTGGTEEVSVSQFNRKMRVRQGLVWRKPNGIQIFQHHGWLQRQVLLGALFSKPPLCLRREDEVMHMAIMGDTGTGKTVFIMQLLAQIADRGETAVVHDPDGTLASIFYDPARGDVILNPFDARCPFWTPGSEVGEDAEYEADTLAASLFPVNQHQNSKDKYFNEWAGATFAHLLKYRPTPKELLFWMRDRAELDRRIKGTGIDMAIEKDAPQQRGGIVSTLNMARRALEYLPDESEAKRPWSIREWSEDRKGWVFLTSHAMTETTLQPMISMWMDQIVLRLMSRKDHPQKTWIVLDELATLQYLPKLEAGITRCRKANAPMVLGLQSKAQVTALYGAAAETTIMSQPVVKVFLRSNHADVAEWVSRSIGKRYMERYRTAETTSSATQKSVTEQMQPDQYDEAAIHAGKIKGNQKLHVYVTCENYVVSLRLAILKLSVRHPGYIVRKMKSAIQPQVEKPSERPFFE